VAESAIRSDQGEGACTAGALLSALGGAGQSIEYRKAGTLDLIQHRPVLLVQLTVVALTLISALFTGYFGFIKNSSDPASSVTHQWAFFVMALAFILAALKSYLDFRDPFK
jgi:hypothetical protein